MNMVVEIGWRALVVAMWVILIVVGIVILLKAVDLLVKLYETLSRTISM